MTGLSVRGLTLAAGPRTLVAEDISFSAPRGAITALLGAAGAGKTILLAGVAGLRKPVRGAVFVNGADVTGARPARRGIFLLPPGSDLGSDRTVAAALRRIAGRSQAALIPELLEIFGITPLAETRLASLSHGQGFAVLAAARLLGAGDVLLVDEAGTGLGEPAQAALLAWLAHQAASGRTIVLATRQSAIALAADNLVLLHGGHVLQAGTPAAVYADPRDLDAARLTGEMNVLAGVVRQKIPGGFIWMGGGRKFTQLGAGPALGGQVRLCLRPEQLGIVPAEAEGNTLPAVVTRLGFPGGRIHLCVDSELGPIRLHPPCQLSLRVGQTIAVSWQPDAARLPWYEDVRGSAAAPPSGASTTAARIGRLPTSV